MAWHKRYIIPIPSGTRSSVRLTVEFRRKDLLWISPGSITNPLTGEEINLPISLGNTVAIGPNILDVMKQEKTEIWDEQDLVCADGTKQTMKTLVEKLVWRLRPSEEFFSKEAKTVAKQSDDAESLYDIFQNSRGPLSKSFCTGGTVLGEEGEFLAVEKRSSTSINALVFRLVVGMTGSEAAASQYIGTLASDAWERDLIRAIELYTLITQAKVGYLPDDQVPKRLKANASIAQTVETIVLRDACNWLGIDPDAPINRRQGRPRKRRHNQDGEATSAGQVIELTLQADGTVKGQLIASFLGLPKGTNLATLTLTKLAEILVALRETELAEDADLLEAYLDAADPEWRAKIANEIGVEDSSSGLEPWTILGLSPGASVEEVKKAYKQIMRTIHPDTSGLPRWYAQTVNDAYRKLLEELDYE